MILQKKRLLACLANGVEKRFVSPQEMNLTSYVDTNEVLNFEDWKTEYTILHYVDTVGCVSCKLQLSRWNKFVEELDSISNSKAKCLLSFSPMNKKVLLKSLRINRFDYYVYIDEKDSLNKLNAFPDNEAFHTFLLDENNKVLAIGNPIHNPNIKDLYLRIIRGDVPTRAATPMTTVSFDTTLVDLGHFPWQEPQSFTFTFTLKNTGDRPLTINREFDALGGDMPLLLVLTSTADSTRVERVGDLSLAREDLQTRT